MGIHVVVRCHFYIDGLVQKRRNSIANALELCLSCTNPSILYQLTDFLLIPCIFTDRFLGDAREKPENANIRTHHSVSAESLGTSLAEDSIPVNCETKTMRNPYNGKNQIQNISKQLTKVFSHGTQGPRYLLPWRELSGLLSWYPTFKSLMATHLTYWGRVTHICVIELCHHWFR